MWMHIYMDMSFCMWINTTISPLFTYAHVLLLSQSIVIYSILLIFKNSFDYISLFLNEYIIFLRNFDK